MSVKFQISAITAACLLFSVAPATSAGDSRQCSLMPFSHTRDPRATLLLGVALPDTVFAGPGSVLSADALAGEERGGARAIYGQVISVARFAGADSAALAGLAQQPVRVVVVPWGYGPDCRTAVWNRSARWVPLGQPGAFTVRMRPESAWVNGMPTFDASAADMKPYPLGEALRRRDARADTLTAAEYFDFTRALPVRRSNSSVVTEEDAADILEWRRSNPLLPAKYPADWMLSMIRSAVGSRSIDRYLRALEPEVAGTYRITFSLRGAGPDTIYVRTHAEPRLWWYRREPAMAPEPWLQEMPRPDGYTLMVSGARSLDLLPSVCAGVRSSAAAYMDVADPPPVQGESTWERAASIEPQLLARQFPFDTALQGFARESFREFSEQDEAAPKVTPARFWRTADGALRVEQTDTLRDGRVLSLAGERISDRTIRCRPENAQDAATMAAETAALTRVIDTIYYVGRVVDENTGAPVASAVVYPSAYRASLTTTTDAGGYFRLALPTVREHPRSYVVTAAAPGSYQERRVVSLGAGQCVMPACPVDHPDTMNFRMRPAPPWSLLEVCSGKECSNLPRGSQPTGAARGIEIDSVLVVGRVTDERSGLSLPGAIVESRDGRKNQLAIADSLGFYRLALPTATDSAKTYFVAASWYGYSRAEREISVPPRFCERTGCPDQPEALNFPLRREDRSR